MSDHLLRSGFCHSCRGCCLIVCIHGGVVLPTLNFYKPPIVPVLQLISAHQIAHIQAQTDTWLMFTGYVADPHMHAPYTKAVVNAFYAVLDNAHHMLVYRQFMVRDKCDHLLSRPRLVSRILAVVGGLKGHAAEQLTASACLARLCSLEDESSCNTKPNHYRVTALREGVFHHIFLAIQDALGVGILLWPVQPSHLARILHGLIALPLCMYCAVKQYLNRTLSLCHLLGSYVMLF